MEVHNIPYFRNLWEKNVSDLENECKVWEKICKDNPVPDDVHGEIRTAIGLARLLQNQKLKQFKGLIDDSEFHTGEKEITCSDLEGFWDMVYFEVQKIQKSFDRLNKCKENDWIFTEENLDKPVKKVPIKKDIMAINKKKEISNAQMLAARQRIAEAKKKIAAEYKKGINQNNVEILLTNKEEKSQRINSIDNKRIIIAAGKESNESKNQSLPASKKKSTAAEITKFDEESLNDATKQKAAQRRKQPASNKENVFSNKDYSDVKPASAKQAKSSEFPVQEPEKTRTKQSFVKLQCITRSAAKKALLLQRNAM